MPIILENVSYTYAPKTPFECKALRNISLKIEDGEFVGIMGRTGCGKSTLIQIIDGLIAPDCGKILLDGRDINEKRYDKSELRKKIGVVFQYPEYQLFETTVEKDTAFGLRHLKLSKKQVKQQIKQALETVGFDFERVCELSPFGFSGGEKRRLAIAGVLACNPKILILDEPSASLDPSGREEFLKLIKELNDNGTTIIMISHNTDALAEYAKRIIVMDNGSIIRDGSTKDVLNDCDFLMQNGLSTAQVSEIAQMLRNSGIAIDQDIVRYDELLSFLIGRKEQCI